MLQEFDFRKHSKSRSTRPSRGRLPNSASLPLQRSKTLMHFENLKMKAIAVIKLFKDFAKQYTHRAASRARSLGNSPPTPEEKLHKKPTARHQPSHSRCSNSAVQPPANLEQHPGFPLGSESSPSPPSRRATGFSPRSRQP